MVDHSIIGGVLVIEGTPVTTVYPIKAAYCVATTIVVLLDVPPTESMTENVFGFNKSGEMLWQIERVDKTSLDKSNIYTSGCNIDSTLGTIEVFNWNGWNMTVDVKTGAIANCRFRK